MPPPPRVVIKPRRARPFFARHPWVLAPSIASVEGDPEPGAEVEVFSHEGQRIARGLINPRSGIRVRLYRWDGGPLDDAFWSARVDAALKLRDDLPGLLGPETPRRLVASEADGLSGLVVDRYDCWLVVQFTSLALHAHREPLLARLVERTGASGVILRTEKGMAEQEGLAISDGPISGTPPEGPIAIVENEIRYEVDLGTGQKTGFYIDQRDNRRAVAAYARGRRVLDLCCYTGAFALNALKHGGAASALGIDSSAGAIEIARRNAVANQLGAARFEAADAFDVLAKLQAAGDRFGLVICDPPKFARHPRSVPDAIKGYLRLNRAALGVLEPDGILATFSCTGLVDRAMFADVLAQVAEHSGRPIQFLERLGQPPDHPVSASCPEGEYLNGFIARVGPAEGATPAAPVNLDGGTTAQGNGSGQSV